MVVSLHPMRIPSAVDIYSLWSNAWLGARLTKGGEHRMNELERGRGAFAIGERETWFRPVVG